MQTRSDITAEDFKARMDRLIADNPQGEDLLITTEEGQPAAKLTILVREPYRIKNPWKLFGMMKDQIELLPGWDEPLDGFKLFAE